MPGKLLFVLGAGIGYVFGARAGRERYEAMKAQADNLWNDPRVQEKFNEAGQAVKDRAPDVQAKLADAAGAVKETVKEKVTSSGSNQAKPPSIDGAELAGTTDLGASGPPDVPDQQMS